MAPPAEPALLFMKTVPAAAGEATAASGQGTAGLAGARLDGAHVVRRPPSTQVETAMAPPETEAAFESNALEATDRKLLRAAVAPPLGAELFANVEL